MYKMCSICWYTCETVLSSHFSYSFDWKFIYIYIKKQRKIWHCQPNLYVQGQRDGFSCHTCEWRVDTILDRIHSSNF